MTEFVMVHAAWHGAWCWEGLIAQLQALGHRATAVELPSDDPSAGCTRYAEVVVDALADSRDDVIVVGHSLGGATIPLVAAARPVRRLVFLAALMPEPGRSLDDQLRSGARIVSPAVGEALERDAETTWLRDEDAIRLFYHDCSPAVARAAAARLRPQARAPFRERCPLSRWPPTETTCVICQQDRVIDLAWARQAARERCRAPAVELAGGHSPFLSRSGELAGVLASYA